MEAAKRVFLNTGFLYVKMIITMFISLFSTRLILGALGVNDFGTYNIVGGVIGMLNFLNAAMTISTQRYLSYYIGASNMSKLKAVFLSSTVLHLVIAFIVVLLFEIVGVFLFRGALNIPEERIHAAKIVYHFMVVSTFFVITAVPYDAAIVAHENMLADAVLGIFESVSKLGIAIWLVYTSSDKLILYGLLTSVLVIILRIVKSIFCYKNYEETGHFLKAKFDTSLIKEMFSFAGWNLFGSFCHVLRTQGLSIVLNISIGVIANAAYGIANQVNMQVTSFSSNMRKALNPQIIKSEGGQDRERMLRLASMACKIAVVLMSFFAIPLILEMKFVLKLWLNDVPVYAIKFCQLSLIASLLMQVTSGLQSAIQSTGIIRNYQIVVGTLLMLNIPVAIVLLKIGLPPHSVFIGSIGLEIIAGILRILFAKKTTKLPVRRFIRNVVLSSAIVVLPTFLIAKLPALFMDDSFSRLIITVVISSFSIILFARFFVLNNDEYLKLKEIVFNIFLRLKKNPLTVK